VGALLKLPFAVVTQYIHITTLTTRLTIMELFLNDIRLSTLANKKIKNYKNVDAAI
jgi:hypothetical protein